MSRKGTDRAIQETTKRIETQLQSSSDEQLTEWRAAIDAEIRRRDALKATEMQKTHVSQLPGSSADKVKFRDPKNQFNTWSGRGRKPDWLRKFLADGGNIDEVKV
jgi:DNA-binding protein H-NS